MSTTHSLKAVGIELDHWRANKEKSSRIPDNLWSKIINLIDKHSMKEICRFLKLNQSQLKNKVKPKDPFALNSDTPFYELSVPSIKHQQTEVQLGASIEVKRPDGITIVIKQLSNPALLSLVSTFLGGT